MKTPMEDTRQAGDFFKIGPAPRQEEDLTIPVVINIRTPVSFDSS